MGKIISGVLQYCHATFHRSVYYDTLHHCHIAQHDHVVDIIFVANPPFIILSYMSLISQCTSRYTAGGIHIESYLVLVSSGNHYVVINRSVMIIIIRALPNQKKGERPKRKKERPKKRENKKGNATISFSTLVLQSSTLFFMQ